MEKKYSIVFCSGNLEHYRENGKNREQIKICIISDCLLADALIILGNKPPDNYGVGIVAINKFLADYKLKYLPMHSDELYNSFKLTKN